MKTVKQTAEYTVLQRGDGRYAVRGKDRKWVNGEAKVEILIKEKLLEKPKSKPKPDAETKEESAAEEPAADAASGDAAGDKTEGDS